jgi:hypothetical protein
MRLAERINQHLLEQRAPLLTPEQVACIEDSSRLREAAELLDGLSSRHRFLIPFKGGAEFGPFTDEDTAREAAEEQSHKYAAVAIDEMATDDGRSYGDNLYFVTGFEGPEAILAAICKSNTGAYWANGELIDE